MDEIWEHIESVIFWTSVIKLFPRGLQSPTVEQIDSGSTAAWGQLESYSMASQQLFKVSILRNLQIQHLSKDREEESKGGERKGSEGEKEGERGGTKTHIQNDNLNVSVHIHI